MFFTTLKRIKGIGQSEFLIITMLIGIAAISAFQKFGQVTQHQVSALATEVSGGVASHKAVKAAADNTNPLTSVPSIYGSKLISGEIISSINPENNSNTSRSITNIAATSASSASADSYITAADNQISETHSASAQTDSEPSLLSIILSNVDGFAGGLKDGLASQATDLLDMFLHPIETARNLYSIAEMLITDPAVVAEAILAEISTNLKGLASSDPQKIGQVIGENLSPAMLGSIATKAAKLIKAMPETRRSPSCCCFAAGTLVSTPEGFQAIEQLEVGDLVQSKNINTGVIEARPVTELFLTQGKELYALTTVNAYGFVETVQVTDNHPYWVEGQWIESAQLKPGMVLVDEADDVAEVQSLKALGKVEDTYNIEVAGNHTYFVGESRVLVHNECVCNLEPSNAATKALLNRKLLAEQIANGHAFTKHLLHQGQFPWIKTKEQFAAHIESILNNPSHHKTLGAGREAFYDDKTSTIIIFNPADKDYGTAFQVGIEYFNNQK